MEQNNQTDLEEVIQEVEQENTVEETVEQDLSKFKSKDDEYFPSLGIAP